jgi:uncharacterized membrane protein
MIHLVIAITIGGIAILNAVLFWFVPRLTRPDLYFAVTVAPDFRDKPEGKSILRRYRIELILLSVLALTAFVAGISRLGVGFVPGGFFIHLIVAFIAFYRARHRALPYAVPPSMIRETDLHGKVQIIPGGWLVASGPFILMAACAAYLWINGAETPLRISSHWASGWEQNRLVARLSIYVLNTAGILAALTLILYGMTRWVRSVYAVGPEAARELKFRKTVLAVILVTEYYITLQASWMVLVPRNDLRTVVLLPFAFVFVLVTFIVLARLGQGGNRMPAADKTRLVTSGVPVGDRTPDRCWKLGIFYFNRDDSAVLVEKRFGLGYSLNFARPIAWIIVLLVLMGPLIPILAHLLHFLPKFRG